MSLLPLPPWQGRALFFPQFRVPELVRENHSRADVTLTSSSGVRIAQAAGLRAPVIFGGVESKKYILEANGCGCAFIDYDNDG